MPDLPVQDVLSVDVSSPIAECQCAPAEASGQAKVPLKGTSASKEPETDRSWTREERRAVAGAWTALLGTVPEGCQVGKEA